jgi:hypothetical protein
MWLVIVWGSPLLLKLVVDSTICIKWTIRAIVKARNIRVRRFHCCAQQWWYNDGLILGPFWCWRNNHAQCYQWITVPIRIRDRMSGKWIIWPRTTDVWRASVIGWTLTGIKCDWTVEYWDQFKPTWDASPSGSNAKYA